MNQHPDGRPAPAAKAPIGAQAADWLARRNGDFTAQDEAAFAAWLAADSRHASAYAEMNQAWATLNHARDTRGPAATAWIEAAATRRVQARRRHRALVSLGAAAALAVALILVRPGHPAAPLTPVAPFEARPTIRTLADGSQVALKSGAEIELRFSAAERGVHLRRGEAIFTVARDPRRPFVVTARGVAIRAVGTEFAVRHTDAEIAVLVTEGRVAVSRPAEPTAATATASAELYAVAGDRVLVPTAAPGPPRLAPIGASALAAMLAWRGLRLEFSETPLAEAIASFNRERSAPALILADPALGSRTLTGVVWADDADGFVRLLETGFDLIAERDGAAVRLRSRR